MAVVDAATVWMALVKVIGGEGAYMYGDNVRPVNSDAAVRTT